MAAPLELSICDDDAEWDALVRASAQGTVFSQSGFLRSLGCSFKRYVVRSQNKPLALCAAPEDAGGTKLTGFAFTPYLGILFLHDAASPVRQRVLDEFRLSEFFIEALTARYRDIAMALSWHFGDLRPFLWHHYHEAEAPHFTTIPRYTALLDLATVDAETFPARVRACRRQELRKAAPYAIREESEVDTFLRLYELTFARQDIALAPETLALVRSITCAALEQGYGRLSSCSTPDGVASMNLFLYDQRRAYYLFAASDPAFRNTGAATRLMFDNIYHAKQRGTAEFDFVGANSPNRGDFKLSFGAELKLYFELRYAGAARAET